MTSHFAAIVDARTRLGDKEPANLTDVSDLASGQSESAASRLVELKAEKNKSVDRVSKPECEHVKIKAKVLSFRKQVNKLRVGRTFVSAEVVAAGARGEKLNDELSSQKTGLEILRATLAEKTDFC